MNRDDSRSAVAELVAAIAALKIAEQFFVDDITEFGSGHGTSRATEQTTEDCAGKATEQHACRTSDSADGCTGLCSG